MPQKKYQHYLEDRNLKRWYDATSRGSMITADVNLRRLGSFCDRVKIDPQQLLDKEPRDLTDLIDDFVTDMEKEGFSPNYILSILKGVKSWIAHNNLALTRKIKVTNSGKNRLKERVPTQDELKRILASGDPRSRVASILMAHSGVRPEVIGNYKGKDGLTVGDFPEMEISDGEVSFSRTPTPIIVREELSKAGNEYFTFMGNEACYYLKAYLEERIRSGEKITSGSPLIVPSKAAYAGRFISTINIGDIIRQPIRKAGFDWRPYVLRSYFDSQLMMAESKGLIIRDYRSFFMGHKGDIEGTYTTSKIQNPESIESMRESYEKALKFLETESRGISEEDHNQIMREHSIRTLAMITGAEFSDEEKERLLTLDESDFWKEFNESYKNKKADILNNGNSQKVVSVKEVKDYINKGWEYVNTLPGNKEVIVKLP